MPGSNTITIQPVSAHLELVAVDTLATSSITTGEVASLDHEAGLHTTMSHISLQNNT